LVILLKSKNFWFKKVLVFNASVIGNNLFAFTQNPHFDPEQLAVQETDL
jgi:hypothetical protein